MSSYLTYRRDYIESTMQRQREEYEEEIQKLKERIQQLQQENEKLRKKLGV